MPRTLIKLVATLCSIVLLSGCATVLVAGAVVTTVDIIHDRRTVGEYIDDSAIEVTAQNRLIANKEFRESAHIKADSWNGILLLTGEVDNESTRQRLVNNLAGIQGVRQVGAPFTD